MMEVKEGYPRPMVDRCPTCGRDVLDEQPASIENPDPWKRFDEAWKRVLAVATPLAVGAFLLVMGFMVFQMALEVGRMHAK